MAVRYIVSGGTGDGSSLASAASPGSMNAQIIAAGPGGEVRLIGPTIDWSGVTITAGGADGDPVRIHGVATNGATSALVRLVGTRTAPWPFVASGPVVGAKDGNTLFTLNAGANNLHFYDINGVNSQYVFRRGSGVSINNLWLGYVEEADNVTSDAVAAFRTNYSRWERSTPAAVTAANAIFTLANSFTPSRSLTNAFNMTNIMRGIDDAGSSSDTAAGGFFGLKWVGGTIRGCGKGILRLRAQSADCLIQDVDSDAERQVPTTTPDFCEGFECNARAHDVTFLRVRSDNCWHSMTSGYLNGDGFSSERTNTRLNYIACKAAYNTDGGIDSKATDRIIIGLDSHHQRRSCRLWGWGHTYNVNSHDLVPRSGGSSHHFYSENSDFEIICSATITFGDGPLVEPFYAAGTAALMVSTDVVIDGKPSNVPTFKKDSTAFADFYNPTDRTAPVVTSSGDRVLTELKTATYVPTTSKITRWYRDDPVGPDAAFVSVVTYRTITIAGKLYDTPLDADGNNVYQANFVGYSANGVPVHHPVSFAMAVPAPIVPPNILGRMTSAGSPAPNSTLGDAYNEFLASAVAKGYYKKIDSIVGASHAYAASRIDWSLDNRNGLSNDGSRAFPFFSPGVGWFTDSTGRWCYQGGVFGRMTRDYASMFIWTTGIGGGDYIGGAYASISGGAAGSATIRANNSTGIAVPGAMVGDDSFFGWSRDGNQVKTYTDGVLVNTTVQVATTDPFRPRFLIRDNGNSKPVAPVMWSIYGTSFTDVDVSNLFTDLAKITDVIKTYFREQPPIAVSPPSVLGIYSVGEQLTIIPAKWNFPYTSSRYVWKVDGVVVGTGNTYTQTADDINKPIIGQMYVTNAYGESLPSETAPRIVASPPPTFFIAPTAPAGSDLSGTTPANAVAFANMNALAVAHPGAIMALRADLGTYARTSPLTINTPDMIIDSWHPTDPTILATIDGGRNLIPSSIIGSGIFSLGGAAKNIVIRRIRFENAGSATGGAGAITALVGVNGLFVYDCHFENCYRAHEFGKSAPHVNVFIHDNTCHGLERSFVRIGGGSNAVYIYNNTVDAGGSAYVGDDFMSLIVCEGGHDFHIENNTVSNAYMVAEKDDYTNADNFETTGTCYDMFYTDCHSTAATDGGFDLGKEPNPNGGFSHTLTDCTATRNAHNLRSWGGAIHTIRFRSEGPLIQDIGLGGAYHFGFNRDGGYQFHEDPTVIATPGDNAPIFHSEKQNCVLVVHGTSNIQVNPGQDLVDFVYPSCTAFFDPPVPGFDASGKRLASGGGGTVVDTSRTGTTLLFKLGLLG